MDCKLKAFDCDSAKGEGALAWAAKGFKEFAAGLGVVLDVGACKGAGAT